LYVRDKGGSILGGHGYMGRVELPIQINSWSVERRSFRIERLDEKQMNDILIKDIDDNVIVYSRSQDDKWVRSKKTKERKRKILRKGESNAKT
jgi:hypothetical protein